MNILNVYKLGYNRSPTAHNSKGIKRSEETLQKMRAYDNYKKANKVWKGSKHTEASLDIMRAKRATQDMSWMQSDSYRAKKKVRSLKCLVKIIRTVEKLENTASVRN